MHSNLHCLRVLITSATLCALTLSLPAGARQGSAEYASGGLISWPWIQRNPANPAQLLLWTAEDGGRIRFETIATPGAPGLSARTFQSIVPVPGSPPFRSILRDIEVAGVKGLAVGDNSSWLWAFQAHLPGATWDASPVVWDATSQPIGDVRLWDVELQGPSAYVVGEGGLLAYAPSALPAAHGPARLIPANFVGEAPRGALRGIDFYGVRGIAVGDLKFDELGELDWGLHFTDDGQNWYVADIKFTTPQGVSIAAPPDAEFELFKVDFVPNSLVAYAIGGVGPAEGLIFCTRDGGQTWNQELHECDAVTSGPCYPPGDRHCTPTAAPCGTAPAQTYKHWGHLNGMYGVAAFDDESATAVGYSAMIVTRDNSVAGPCKWREVSSRCDPSTMQLWGVHGDDVDTAVLVGTPEQIRVTTDAGLSWANMSPIEGSRFKAGAAASGGVGGVLWMVGQSCRIVYSKDGGSSWTEQFAFSTGPDQLRQLRAIDVFDDQDGDAGNDVAVAIGRASTDGPADDRPTVLVTIDGGSSCWQLQTATNLGLAVADIRDVASGGVDPLTNEPLFWIAGFSGALARGAISSTPQWTAFAPSAVDPALSPLVDWAEIAFDGEKYGWLLGEVGANLVAYSTNQGDQAPPVWAPVAIPTGVTLSRFSATGHVCFAIGTDASGAAGVWRTSGGAFVPLGLPQMAEKLTAIAATGDASPVIYVGGERGLLWRGSGSPITWTEERSLTTLGLMDIVFRQPALGHLFGGPPGLEIEGGGANSVMRWR